MTIGAPRRCYRKGWHFPFRGPEASWDGAFLLFGGFSARRLVARRAPRRCEPISAFTWKITTIYQKVRISYRIEYKMVNGKKTEFFGKECRMKAGWAVKFHQAGQDYYRCSPDGLFVFNGRQWGSG